VGGSPIWGTGAITVAVFNLMLFPQRDLKLEKTSILGAAEMRTSDHAEVGRPTCLSSCCRGRSGLFK